MFGMNNMKKSNWLRDIKLKVYKKHFSNKIYFYGTVYSIKEYIYLLKQVKKLKIGENIYVPNIYQKEKIISIEFYWEKVYIDFLNKKYFKILRFIIKTESNFLLYSLQKPHFKLSKNLNLALSKIFYS